MRSNTRSSSFLVCLLVAWFALPVFGAAAEVPALSGATSPVAETIHFGDSVVALNGPWKFQVGDSPTDPATGELLWALPGFDDSTWEEVSLKPRPGWTDPYNGDPRYIPGWTANTHPGYMGYAWYRLRVSVRAKQGAQLALACPVYADDGYQVFANGELIGGLGGLAAKPPVVSSTVPLMLMVPDTFSSGSAMQVIAFRVWMGPMGLTHSPYAGGLHYAPYLGEAGAVAERTRLDWLELAMQSAYAPFEAVLLFLFGIVAAGLILFDRSDHVYLWAAAVLLFTALADAALTVFTLTQVLSLRTYFMFFDVFANPLVLCGWIMVWWHWFRLRQPTWVPKLVGGLMLLYMVTKAIGGDFFYGADLRPPMTTFNVISVVVRLVFLPLFIFIMALGIRKQGSEGWLVLPAVVPLIISQFASELIVLDLPVKWAPFGITIFVGQVSNLISAAAISLLLLRRLLLSVRRQRLMELDVKQAQEVQQVILPEARTVIPGLKIESEYRPALQVGGDFFQIIPDSDDGSLLIVAGDVAGKGLKAGMLVALLVGAVRSTAESESAPAAILAALNRRLLGRSDARATCLAMRIERDGVVTLANAGHLPPYLNGSPVDIAGSLPLGMIEQLECSVEQFSMAESDRILLLSDGVAEATDKDGNLFGFERVLELIRTQPTAAKIAEVAQAFGQEDDISVIAVTRIAVAEPALA